MKLSLEPFTSFKAVQSLLVIALLSVTTASSAQQSNPPQLRLPTDKPTPPPSVALAKQLSDAIARASDIAKPYTVIVRGPTVQPTQPNQPPQPIIGSGIIVSPDGLILTSNRNLRGAKTVRVVLINQRNDFAAQVVAIDSMTDLALIKIEATNLPVARLGNSDTVRVGDWVMAIGVPFGLPWSVTSGIISATNRTGARNSKVAVLQTDTAINSGNVGGPLVNLDGEVIGICSALTSKSGAFEGVAYCVPINLARTFLSENKAGGVLAQRPADPPPAANHPAPPRQGAPQRNDPPPQPANPRARGYLGAQLLDLDEETARRNNLTHANGVIVVGVVQDGPADKAGVEAGDIITRFNGRNASDVSMMRLLLESTRPGTTVPLDVYRDGKQITIPVRIAEQ